MEILEVNKILGEIKNSFNVLISRIDWAEENENRSEQLLKLDKHRRKCLFPPGAPEAIYWLLAPVSPLIYLKWWPEQRDLGFLYCNSQAMRRKHWARQRKRGIEKASREKRDLGWGLEIAIRWWAFQVITGWVNTGKTGRYRVNSPNDRKDCESHAGENGESALVQKGMEWYHKLLTFFFLIYAQ